MTLSLWKRPLSRKRTDGIRSIVNVRRTGHGKEGPMTATIVVVPAFLHCVAFLDHVAADVAVGEVGFNCVGAAVPEA